MHTLASQKIADDIVRPGCQVEAQRRHAARVWAACRGCRSVLLGHRCDVRFRCRTKESSFPREKKSMQISSATRPLPDPGLHRLPSDMGTNLVELLLVAHLDPICGQTERIAPAVRSRSGQIRRQGTGRVCPGSGFIQCRSQLSHTTVDTDLSESFVRRPLRSSPSCRASFEAEIRPVRSLFRRAAFRPIPVVEPGVVELPISSAKRRLRWPTLGPNRGRRLEAYAE